jgi:hypothetical protein
LIVRRLDATAPCPCALCATASLAIIGGALIALPLTAWSWDDNGSLPMPPPQPDQFTGGPANYLMTLYQNSAPSHRPDPATAAAIILRRVVAT